MGKVTKLLNKPLKAFTFYSLIVLVCSIPVYYLVVDAIWMYELDEHNALIKKRIAHQLENTEVSNDELKTILSNWNLIQPGSQLEICNKNTKSSDSVYTITKELIEDNQPEVDRFRCLKSVIIIDNQPYLLTLETNVEEVDETLLAIALVTIFFFCFLVAGFILLNRKIAQKVWLPFSKTLDKLKSFDLSRDQSISFEPTEIEEFDELNAELTKLIDKNVSIYGEQKVFIENASHELQTPIAVLKSKIEMLLQSKNLTKEQAEIIEHINAPLARVNKINKNLLLLAKIENNQFLEKEEIEIYQMVLDNLELLEDYIQSKALDIVCQKLNVVKIEVNFDLFEILLNNLIINAIIHSATGSKIKIHIFDNQLLISNYGNAGLNRANLFKRFGVASSSASNSGLGLAIANEICMRYNWKLSYTFENNQHQFKVKF